MSRIFLSLTLALVVTGCGLSSQFRAAAEPPGGARARVRVRTQDSLVRIVPGKDCLDLSTEGSGVVLGAGLGSHGFAGRSLGMPGGKQGDRKSAEFYVEAGKPLVLDFQRGNEAGALGCELSFAFTPEANRDYEVSATLLKLDKTYCVADVRALGLEEKVRITPAKSCEAASAPAAASAQ